MKYKSLITFTFENVTANAKSVMSVLGACVKCGDEIDIVCEGVDEQEALDALCNAVEEGLGE
jgi:phosphocarrier protein